MESILQGKTYVFTVDVEKDVLWDTYLNSFPDGTNQMYRKRREYDCGHCKQFIRGFGNVVVIQDNKLVSIWDFDAESTTFQPVIDALSSTVKAQAIQDIFISKEKLVGVKVNRELLEDGNVLTWEHLHIILPLALVTKSSDSAEALKAKKRDVKNVFMRSLMEITSESVETVLDLINAPKDEKLYKGDEWKGVLKEFLRLQKEFLSIDEVLRNNYCWNTSVNIGGVVGKIRNHSIGTLLINLSKEMNLEVAVKKYENIVSAGNYKRPKPIFSAKMIEAAEKKVIELGLEESLERRRATLEDISINNILFANKDATKRMKKSVFDELKDEVATSSKSFNNVQEIDIEDFIKDMLPSTTSMEVLMENRLSSNLMSLIAPKNAGCKTMLKWDNNFTWAYNGNVADSMKERVKKAGGKVDGVLRFSIQWNDNQDNEDDLDAHCIEPDRNLISFPVKTIVQPSSGVLDVDIVNPKKKVAVENITWSDINRMQDGEYQFIVHCYSADRETRSGFTAEIEYNGEIYHYEYAQPLRQDEKITVARINFSKKNGIKFIQQMPSTKSSQDLWGLKTNQFQPVSVFMLSPNYWNEQKGIGHKHYFFLLDGCEDETQPNGFFNEFLREDLMEYKRQFEALGRKMCVELADNQLSGLGFSSTKSNSMVCKVTDSSSTRTIKIKF